MAQPEQNKTDSDKTKEEALIARLVEIVQSRNEVVDCLEMDRLREAEEDLVYIHYLLLHRKVCIKRIYKFIVSRFTEH